MKARPLQHLALALCASVTGWSVHAAEYPELQQSEKPVRYVQTDPILGKQPHKQQYEQRDGKICPVDMFGNREAHKACLTTESTGVRTEPQTRK